VNPLGGAVGLLVALGVQVALGRVWPEVHRYVDLLLIPVVLFGASGTQRSAMFIGCISGLLHDTWFQVGTFGVTGFRWTLLGWALGSVASRLDLGHGGGRFLVGAGLALADNLVDPLLLRLLDLPPRSHGVGPLIVQVLLTGLLAAAVGSMVDRRTEKSPGMRSEAWRRMA
jgi:hypothetical protein